MNAPSLLIAVVGASSPAPQQALDLAEAVGRELAQRGVILVCGGLDGVMEATCRGAKEAGGVTIGILPGSDAREANSYVDIPICTGMGQGRNLIVVRSGQAVIAIDGGYGTLSEIAHALREGIPVVGLMTWDLFRHGMERDQGIIEAATAEEAVDLAMTLANQRLGVIGT
ncbi:MAG: TIGR00725 family protein [Chloroflexi bacterium]|nr:TIGR00725 family protein [Chloroflexota bacterium]